MAGPWEKYQGQQPAPQDSQTESGPWAKYQAPQQGQPDQTAANASPNQPRQPGFFNRAFDYGMRALDYPGGLVRTGLASAGGLLSGRTDIVKPEDVSNAFQGKAPSSAQYLERAGVTPGPSLKDVPIIGQALPNINLRDAEGFGLDVVSDPLTAIAKGAKALYPESKAATITEKALTSPSAAAEAAGNSIYKSGFKKIDERLLEKGKTPLSDLLLENGAPTGTTAKIADKTDQMLKNLGAERDQLYKRAADKGVTVDLGFPLKNAEAEIARMRDNPGLAKQADALSELLDAYKKQGKVDIAKLSDWKSQLYDALPEAAYAGGRPSNSAQAFKKALSQDFRQAIEDAGNRAESGLGDKIAANNDKMGTILSSEKPMDLQIRRGNTPNLGTSVDAILLGTGHGAALPIKKLADAAKTTYVRTKIGKGLIDAGKSGLLNDSTRRGLIDTTRGLLDDNANQ